jgi:hypothetical protein
MQTVRSVARIAEMALVALLAASLSLPDVLAQGFEKLPSAVAPTPYSPSAQSPSGASRSDHNTDSALGTRELDRSHPERDRSQPSSDSDAMWGSLAFTADGSYSSTWKMVSQPEAEAKVLRQCARFGRGGCEVVSFSGQQCAALATFIGAYRRKRWNLSFTAPGMTYPDAQNAAMERCNSDERTQGHCQPRTAACADGR